MKAVIVMLLMAVMLSTLATPAVAGEWVKFPITWAWCEYDANGTYWCWLDNEQVWTRVNPNWQQGPPGG